MTTLLVLSACGDDNGGQATKGSTSTLGDPDASVDQNPPGSSSTSTATATATATLKVSGEVSDTVIGSNLGGVCTSTQTLALETEPGKVSSRRYRLSVQTAPGDGETVSLNDPVKGGSVTLATDSHPAGVATWDSRGGTEPAGSGTLTRKGMTFTINAVLDPSPRTAATAVEHVEGSWTCT